MTWGFRALAGVVAIFGLKMTAHPIRAGIPAAGKPARVNSWTIPRRDARAAAITVPVVSRHSDTGTGSAASGERVAVVLPVCPAGHFSQCTLSGSGVACPNCGAGRVPRRQSSDHRRAAPSCSGAGLVPCPPVRPTSTACVASGVKGAGSASGFSHPLELRTASGSDPATPNQGGGLPMAFV